MRNATDLVMTIINGFRAFISFPAYLLEVIGVWIAKKLGMIPEIQGSLTDQFFEIFRNFDLAGRWKDFFKQFIVGMVEMLTPERFRDSIIGTLGLEKTSGVAGLTGGYATEEEAIAAATARRVAREGGAPPGLSPGLSAAKKEKQLKEETHDRVKVEQSAANAHRDALAAKLPPDYAKKVLAEEAARQAKADEAAALRKRVLAKRHERNKALEAKRAATGAPDLNRYAIDGRRVSKAEYDASQKRQETIGKVPKGTNPLDDLDAALAEDFIYNGTIVPIDKKDGPVAFGKMGGPLDNMMSPVAEKLGSLLNGGGAAAAQAQPSEVINEIKVYIGNQAVDARVEEVLKKGVTPFN